MPKPMPKMHYQPDRDRKPMHPDITEQMIETLVRKFYDRIRADDLLGPVFDAGIGDNWEPHLQKMFAFWSSVSLKTSQYSGNPMQAHFKLEGLTSEMFQRWLVIFQKTAHEVCGEEIGELFYAPASKIARALEMGIVGTGSQSGMPLKVAPPSLQGT